jgi:putative membrane protein
MMHDGFGSGFGHFSNWLCGPGAFFPGPLGWIITLFFWGLIIYLVVKLFQALFSGGKRISTTALDTLKERFARGEINEDEYRRMKTELG